MEDGSEKGVHQPPLEIKCLPVGQHHEVGVFRCPRPRHPHIPDVFFFFFPAVFRSNSTGSKEAGRPSVRKRALINETRLNLYIFSVRCCRINKRKSSFLAGPREVGGVVCMCVVSENPTTPCDGPSRGAGARRAGGFNVWRQIPETAGTKQGGCNCAGNSKKANTELIADLWKRRTTSCLLG